jgi:hypothetical protein
LVFLLLFAADLPRRLKPGPGAVIYEFYREKA